MNKDPFKEYIKESEASKRDKAMSGIAIGLEPVDGLQTSDIWCGLLSEILRRDNI